MKVFIGFDPRQPVAFQVAAHSIWKHASQPVSIIRLDLRTLPIQRRGLTEFTYSRYLVPYLSRFKGYSLFLDSDVLVRADVWELMSYAQQNCLDADVLMVKHPVKRFEWPSVMLFRNENYPLRQLTPEFIDDRANKLYDLSWAQAIGELPKEWNHLVGYDPSDPKAKIVHFTRGIPIWKETIGCEFAEEWKQTFAEMNSSVSFEALMGPSVHAAGMRIMQ